MYQLDVPFHRSRRIRRVPTPSVEQAEEEDIDLSLDSASILCCFKAASVDSSSAIWSSRPCLLGIINGQGDDDQSAQAISICKF